MIAQCPVCGRRIRPLSTDGEAQGAGEYRYRRWFTYRFPLDEVLDGERGVTWRYFCSHCRTAVTVIVIDPRADQDPEWYRR